MVSYPVAPVCIAPYVTLFRNPRYDACLLSICCNWVVGQISIFSFTATEYRKIRTLVPKDWPSIGILPHGNSSFHHVLRANNRTGIKNAAIDTKMDTNSCVKCVTAIRL